MIHLVTALIALMDNNCEMYFFRSYLLSDCFYIQVEITTCTSHFFFNSYSHTQLNIGLQINNNRRQGFCYILPNFSEL